LLDANVAELMLKVIMSDDEMLLHNLLEGFGSLIVWALVAKKAPVFSHK